MVTLITITKRCTSQINTQSYLDSPLSHSFIHFYFTFLFMQSLNLFQFIIFQHQRRKSAEGLLHQVHRHLVPRLHLLHLLLPHGVRPCQHHLAQEVSIIIIINHHHHFRHHHFRHHHLRRHHPTQEVRSDLETFRAVVPHATVACQTSHKKSLIVQGGGRPDDKDFSQPDPGGGP